MGSIVLSELFPLFSLIISFGGRHNAASGTGDLGRENRLVEEEGSKMNVSGSNMMTMTHSAAAAPLCR